MNLFYGAEPSDYFENAEPGDITEVADPLGSGVDVFKVVLPDDHTLGITENPRAELLSPSLIQPGGEYWLRSSVLFPANLTELPVLTGWMTIFSIYGPPGTGSAPFHLQAGPVEGVGEALYWQRNETYAFDIPWAVPLVRGAWIEIVVHERFDEAGWVELWVGGESVPFFNPLTSPWNPNKVAETNHLLMATRDATNSGGDNHAKILQYREKDQFEVGEIYFKPLSLATTKADLDLPGGASLFPLSTRNKIVNP